MNKKDKMLAAVMEVLNINDPELVDQPVDIGYQQGTIYEDGGYDFREVYCHRETGQEVEVFWSHVDQEAKAVK